MDVRKTFGRNLRNYRKRAGLTQEKLSELLNITPKHLSIIENGMNFVSAEIIEKASTALHVSAASFFYDDEEVNGSNLFIDRVDFIIEDELNTVIKNIKNRIRG
jgi:transcriptional regulator with XRE-family HTH domain